MGWNDPIWLITAKVVYIIYHKKNKNIFKNDQPLIQVREF